jgi:hypothetical protein
MGCRHVKDYQNLIDVRFYRDNEVLKHSMVLRMTVTIGC